MRNTASLQRCSAASDREGRGGGRQGTASLLRLPQFLFNCLLIYLIMVTTRTSGQAASMLFLKQFIALRSLLLNNSPSLLDLHHVQSKHRTSPSPSAAPSRSSKMARVAEAPRQERQEAQDTRHLQGTEIGEASPHRFNSQIWTNASTAGSTAYQIGANQWHFHLPHWFSSDF